MNPSLNFVLTKISPVRNCETGQRQWKESGTLQKKQHHVQGLVCLSLICRLFLFCIFVSIATYLYKVYCIIRVREGHPILTVEQTCYFTMKRSGDNKNNICWYQGIMYINTNMKIDLLCFLPPPKMTKLPATPFYFNWCLIFISSFRG